MERTQTVALNLNNPVKQCTYKVGDPYEIKGKIVATDDSIGTQTFNVDFTGNVEDVRSVQNKQVTYYLEKYTVRKKGSNLVFSIRPALVIDDNCSGTFLTRSNGRKSNGSATDVTWDQPFTKFESNLTVTLNGMTQDSYGIREHIYTSCMDESTLITAANGEQVLLHELLPGEFILNPMTGVYTKVKQIIRGIHDPEMYELAVGTKKILLTSNHPVLTEEGPKTASEITTRDSIRFSDGSFDRVTSATKVPGDKKRDVYNIVLDTDSTNPEDHYLLANGIVVGDQFLQDALSAE